MTTGLSHLAWLENHVQCADIVRDLCSDGHGTIKAFDIQLTNLGQLGAVFHACCRAHLEMKTILKRNS